MALTQTGTDGIKDDAITLAKQAAGTDGQIITYDASGNPVAVGPGTDGQVLTSTGAGSPPAFEAIPTPVDATKTTLTGSTNNTITTVTGANAIQGEANLTFDGTTLNITDTELSEASDNFTINIQSGNNDFYVKSGGTTIAAFKGLNKNLEITDGDLVIETAGHGINFHPHSGTDNLLSDYETGSWTPINASGQMVGSLANNGAWTIGATGAKYTKIGNTVHFSADTITIPSTGGQYTFILGGLPFTNISINAGLNNVVSTDSGANEGLVVSGQSYIYFYDTNSTTANKNTHLSGAIMYGISGTYTTA